MPYLSARLGLLFCTLFLSGPGKPPSSVPSPAARDSASLTVFLIAQPSDFQCPFCRHGFQQVCDSLHRYEPAFELICILRTGPYNIQSPEHAERLHLYLKQLKGYLRGFGLRAPVLMDAACVFSAAVRETPVLILIHPGFQVIREYPVPITHQDLLEFTFYLQTASRDA
jgi:hypothetical protein